MRKCRANVFIRQLKAVSDRLDELNQAFRILRNPTAVAHEAQLHNEATGATQKNDAVRSPSRVENGNITLATRACGEESGHDCDIHSAMSRLDRAEADVFSNGEAVAACPPMCLGGTLSSDAALTPSDVESTTEISKRAYDHRAMISLIRLVHSNALRPKDDVQTSEIVGADTPVS